MFLLSKLEMALLKFYQHLVIIIWVVMILINVWHNIFIKNFKKEKALTYRTIWLLCNVLKKQPKKQRSNYQQ